MKILRSIDWEPAGYSDSFDLLGGEPVFFFKHRKHEDVVALKVAKYVDVTSNIVFFFNSLAEERVCVSRKAKERINPSQLDELINKIIPAVN